jgi:hypothetical protein
MASPQLGLLPLLVDVLREPEKGEAREKVIKFFFSIALAAEVRSMMLSTELGLLLVLLMDLWQDCDKVPANQSAKVVGVDVIDDTASVSSLTAESKLCDEQEGGEEDKDNNRSSSSDPQEDALIVCWKLLHDPKKAVDPAKLAALRSDLGLFEVFDLPYCDGNMCAQLASQLKPAQRNKFKSLMSTLPLRNATQPSAGNNLAT